MELKVVYIQMPEEMRRRARARAALQGLTVSDYVTALVRADARASGLSDAELSQEEADENE